ncbi:MAG: hypothetical protein M3Q56_06785 [Bacteroidota bacterium]|nr:hypothetical protein [Bacteroidota bacterium]
MHQDILAIANYKLNIDKLKTHFKDKKVIETANIIAFYNKFEKEVKPTTINWRVYSLVQMGILKRIGRGRFSMGEGKNYVPEISPKLKTTYTKLKKEFPYLDICIWNTSALNEFMAHQPGRFYILIEAEKQATRSVFFFLKEAKYSVFLDPTKDILDKYLPEEKEVFIVKLLVSEAPLQNINGINTASIEKMLVDVFCDDIIFSTQQGSEMRTIFKEALSKYSINESRMFRYADRRRKKESFTKYLNSISNLRKQA